MLEFIYNEKSGKGKSKKAMKKIEAYLAERSIPYHKTATTHKKHATDIARELSKNGATDIIAVGGDGTIHEVLNGLDVEKVNFGIIPAGSGNDFVESAKIPSNPLKALDIILNDTPKPTDFMECSGIRGLNVIGTGIDAEILKRCESSKFFRGKIQYLLSLLVSLIKFNFYKFTVVKNDEKHPKEALIVCVGNGKMFGGGIRICPDAQIDDGKLDFVVCNKMKKSKIPGAFIKLMKGKILLQPFTEFSTEKSVKVEFENPTTINIDGELYKGLDFNVKIVEGKLKLYRP